MTHKKPKRLELYEQVKELSGLVCGICNKGLEEEWELLIKWHSETKSKSFKRKSANIDIDHIIPRSYRRGEDWWGDMSNLQLTHMRCNRLKGNNLSTQPHSIKSNIGI